MKRIEKKHPLAIRWFHWINFPVLMVMIWSGLLIYWAHPAYRVGAGGFTLVNLFPSYLFELLHLESRLAEGIAWHFLFMWFFIINGILYVLYTAISGEWRYLLPNRNSFREAFDVVLHDLRLSDKPLPRKKFNGAQQFAYTSIILMGAGSMITGLGIYKPTQFSFITQLVGGYTIARFLHFWLTMGYCAFFLVHIVQVIRAGWNNFRAMITGYEIVEDPQETPVGQEGATTP